MTEDEGLINMKFETPLGITLPEKGWGEWLINRIRSMANLSEYWYKIEYPNTMPENSDEYGGPPDEYALNTMMTVIRSLENSNIKPDFLFPQFEGGIVVWFERKLKDAAIVVANGGGEPFVKINDKKKDFKDWWLIDLEDNDEDQDDELYSTLEGTVEKIRIFLLDDS